MKLQVINENREPESVAPKIKVFDSEADLDAALPDLKDGAIVATKEDETAPFGQPIEAAMRIAPAGGASGATTNTVATLYPLGNGIYLYTAIFGMNGRTWSSNYTAFSYSITGFRSKLSWITGTQDNQGPAVLSVNNNYFYVRATGTDGINFYMAGIVEKV